MKVTIKCKTNWRGKLLNVGDKLDIDDATAARWGKNGIAKLPKAPAQTPTQTTEVEENAQNADLSDGGGS
jgi:hypothetical protein